MTIEEARLTLQENLGYLSFEHPGRITEAIKVAIEALSKPSLPSTLDDAAENYAWGKEEPLAEGERLSVFFKPRADAFKAGAEWMAGQGWSMDGEVTDMPTGGGDCEIYLDYDYSDMESILDKICDYVNNNCPNDENRYKVTIQIRKK